MTPQDRIALIEPLGVEFHTDYRYEGTPGEGRHRIELPDIVTSVFLPLSPQEWCDVGMRESDQYIGPCCGNTSAMQDRINMTFREGGWIDSDEFLYVGQLARGHDGFDEFEEMDDVRFEKLVSVWKKQNDEGLRNGHHSDVWAKLGVIFNAFEPLLKPKTTILPKPERDNPVQTLLDGLWGISWERMISSSLVEDQHAANALLMRAKILDPLRRVLAQLETNDEHFEGFALVKEGTEDVLVNGAGSCIYAKQEEAQRWLDLMNRHNEMEEQNEEKYQRPLEVKADIVPCTVTVAEGLRIAR